jgi:multiple sugar transport system permease protein
MNNLRFKFKIYILCIPGLAGFVLFFLWPFGKSLWYSFVNDVYHKDFVWFDNYLAVFNNQYFRLALKNTLIFSLVGVGLFLLLSITLSLGLSKLAESLVLLKSTYIRQLTVIMCKIYIYFPDATWNIN